MPVNKSVHSNTGQDPTSASYIDEKDDVYDNFELY